MNLMRTVDSVQTGGQRKKGFKWARALLECFLEEECYLGLESLVGTDEGGREKGQKEPCE